MFGRVIGYKTYNDGRVLVFVESGYINNNYIHEYLMDPKHKLTTINPDEYGYFKGYSCISTYVTRGPSFNGGINIESNQISRTKEIQEGKRIDYSDYPIISRDKDKNLKVSKYLYTLKSKFINTLPYFDPRKDFNVVVKGLAAENPDKTILVNLGPAIEKMRIENRFESFFNIIKSLTTAEFFYSKLNIEYYSELNYYRAVDLRMSDQNEFEIVFNSKVGF